MKATDSRGAANLKNEEHNETIKLKYTIVKLLKDKDKENIKSQPIKLEI